ncbi:MAG: transcriptional repressor LexA [Bacillota bacterium]|nr:transcriptional repressor LexA [Bacillota bacterium]
MSYPGLTNRQETILCYIKEVVQKKGYPPSVREIGEAIGLSSPSTVHAHLNALEAKGYIRRDPQKPRALEVLDSSSQPSFAQQHDMADIPLLGKISAGLPTFAEENIEDYFPLPLDYINAKNPLFILRVQGESMIEAGICDGDLLIIESAQTAYNGEIVVALIDDEATVKTFYREPRRIRLQPENTTMDPIYVDHCDIIGRPVGLIRKF